MSKVGWFGLGVLFGAVVWIISAADAGEKFTKLYINGVCYKTWGTHTQENVFEAYDGVGVQESTSIPGLFSSHEPLYKKLTVKFLIIEECKGKE